ncbi:MAG: hypothetical protein D6728_20935 [Cyanobacteria bacterium J055]|nr:MAG: hypothetical protein D6728_20935 [Cyanobacteria bacterium J055]
MLLSGNIADCPIYFELEGGDRTIEGGGILGSSGVFSSRGSRGAGGEKQLTTNKPPTPNPE